jgi:hypothetical protein
MLGHFDNELPAGNATRRDEQQVGRRTREQAGERMPDLYGNLRPHVEPVISKREARNLAVPEAKFNRA